MAWLGVELASRSLGGFTHTCTCTEYSMEYPSTHRRSSDFILHFITTPNFTTRLLLLLLLLPCPSEEIEMFVCGRHDAHPSQSCFFSCCLLRLSKPVVTGKKSPRTTTQNSHITKDTFRPHTSHGRLGSPSRSSSADLFEPQHMSIHR